jgi:hypothetical protein
MGKIDQMTRSLCEKYDLSMEDMWEIRGAGTMVLKNKAIEKIASKEEIRFDRPEVVEGSLKDQAIVLLVTGHKGEHTVSSFASATITNCNTVMSKGGPRVFHPYAYEMAEKRGKARVTLKLISMYGDFYSEDEVNEHQMRGEDRASGNDERHPAHESLRAQKDVLLNILFMHIWREFWEDGSTAILKSIKDRQTLIDLYGITEDEKLRLEISQWGKELKNQNVEVAQTVESAPQATDIIDSKGIS